MGKRKSIVIVAEGAHDKYLNPIKGDYIKDVLSSDTSWSADSENL